MGKRTKINRKANRKLKAMFKDKGITRCENCGGTFGLSFAHKHKRRWYYDKPDQKLWDFNEVLLLCARCHHNIEYNRDLTKKMFEDLR